MSNNDPISATGNPSTGGAVLVAAGIFLSRIAGFVRESIFAYYFGRSAVADAFRGALRIPNLLQNLFGEGVLSASFIPVYAGLLGRGKDEEARDAASAIAGLLALTMGILTLLGLLATPLLIDLIVPGFEGEKRELAVTLVRVFFPGAAMLAMSAWCLGILNSHHKFFLPYAAPVVWNGVIIAALLLFGPEQGAADLAHPAILVAAGVTAGGFLQFLVQLPAALKLLGGLRPVLGLRLAAVRETLRNFVPVLIGRGVVQISAFIDSIIASWLPEGALAAISYAQTIYFLPVSLFGMSVSAAALPAMSKAAGSPEKINSFLTEQLNRGLRQILFFVAPSAVAFLFLGKTIIAFLYQSGRFDANDTVYVWLTLGGLSIGLTASTMSRLCASTFYALHDTKTPLYYALLRVMINTAGGYFFAIVFPPLAGIDPSLGIVGLTAVTGTVGWVEFVLIRRAISKRIGALRLERPFILRVWGAAVSSGAAAFALQMTLNGLHPRLHALIVLPLFALGYLLLTRAFDIPEARKLVVRLTSVLSKR